MKLPKNVILRVVCPVCGQTTAVTRDVRIAAHRHRGSLCTGPLREDAGIVLRAAIEEAARQQRNLSAWHLTDSAQHLKRAKERDRDAAALDAIAAKLGGGR